MPIVRRNSATADTIPRLSLLEPHCARLFPLLGGYLNLSGGPIYSVEANDSRLGPHDQFTRAKYNDKACLKPRRKCIAALFFSVQ